MRPQSNNTTKQGCCNHKHVFNLGEEHLHRSKQHFFAVRLL